MPPLVSILIPALDARNTISDTLRSALAQTWTNTEIIVVDDGSRDDTARVARQVGGSRIRLIRQSNQGAAAARNRAYAVCRGDFIQWLDADDLLAPDKVARQVEVLTHTGTPRTLASGPWGLFMHRPRRAEFRPTALWQDLTPAGWLLRKMRDNLHMQTATWLVTRRLTDAAGPWNPRLSTDDDGEYFCRVLLASDRVKFVPDARVYYRMSGSRGLSYIGRSQRKLESQAISMQRHVSTMLSFDDSAEARAACSNYLRTWLPYFYPWRSDLVAELDRLAADVGVTLEPPTLSWKYEWLRRLFGWNVAKQAELRLPAAKWRLLRAWDKAMFLIGRRDRSAIAG
jgi:glycosyltransferase involved in cell wall biosynthesis